METRYTVRQTVEMTGVKSYVLRYWEEELELQIHRNELGHRYYTGYDIQLFLNIKELKRRGLQLRAIKKLIPQITASMSGFAESGQCCWKVLQRIYRKRDRAVQRKVQIQNRVQIPPKRKYAIMKKYWNFKRFLSG